ncbi:hypothetical protein ACWDWT_01320 [Streptomyces sp. NPDC003343]
MSDQSNAGAVINTSPRPRMLVSGFPGNDDLVDEILKISPTSKKIDNFREVRQAEWDVLVTTDSLVKAQQYVGTWTLEPHLCVIYVATQNNPYGTIERRTGWRGEVRNEGRKVSQEIRRVRELPERIATLVHEKLEPVVTRREYHDLFGCESADSSVPHISPFLTTPDGDILAGRYKRSESSEAWLLPHDVLDLTDWVKAALAEWNSIAPDRFPGLPDWSQQPQWMTAEERRISSEIAKIDDQRNKTLEAFAARENELKEQLAAATESADKFERGLLTTQSDTLKSAVIAALEAMGFSVTDADKSAAPDDHLEDLHINDPDRPGWIALGEVKGYSRGAKTEGITQFLRFNMRYTARTKEIPDANWYIVNQFLNRDPSTRQMALHGKEEDVAAFGDANGLVVDTVTLFNLLTRVQEGTVTPKEARSLLTLSTGRFTLPDAW